MKKLFANPLLMLCIGLITGGVLMHHLDSFGNLGAGAKGAPPPHARNRTKPESVHTPHGTLSDKVRLTPKNNPQDAWSLALETANFSEHSAAICQLARAWAESDPGPALDAARTLPAGILRSDAVESAVSAWAGKKPAEAAAWVQKNLSGPMAGAAFATIADAWSKSDPATAAEWVGKLPGGMLTDGATCALIGNWVRICCAASHPFR